MATKHASAFLACLTLYAGAQSTSVWAQDADPQSDWSYGIGGGAGYFNFRNSLYVDREPDSPGDLGEDWLEFVVKPWLEMEKQTGDITWFGEASWAYVRTDDNAAEISGGAADSADFDDLYVGFRKGSIETGQFEVAAGRYAFELAHGFLLADGNADGGGRGGYWSNARRAWAPGGRIQYRRGGHTIEAFYLDRDERPESGVETIITGANYEWLSSDSKWNLGASIFGVDANQARAHLDGAKVYNHRAYVQPFDIPLGIEAEIAREDNGIALDSHAWYIMADYTFESASWQPILQYRYAFYEGDDPDTIADESFDPLFPSFRDWGTWWQGEIAGEYFLSNSNLKTHMLHLSVQPTENIRSGLLFFNYTLDQPGSYQGGVNSSNLGKEINWYIDWQVFEYVSFNFVVAHNEPGTAVAQAHERSKPFKYAMVYANFAWER
jgi:hypothetical protein